MCFCVFWGLSAPVTLDTCHPIEFILPYNDNAPNFSSNIHTELIANADLTQNFPDSKPFVGSNNYVQSICTQYLEDSQMYESAQCWVTEMNSNYTKCACTSIGVMFNFENL